MTVFFPGSFNPFTIGHADILLRLARIAGKVIVGIGVNPEKPEAEAKATENADAIRHFVAENGLDDKVEVVTYSVLTAEEARRHGADCLARGVRNATDFDAEYALAAANRETLGIDTILIPTSPALSFVSSSLIRDLALAGREDLVKKYLAK